MRVSVALVFIGGIFACDGSLDSESALRPIVDGRDHEGDPAVVLLDLGGTLCTGTLISPRVVLTAAHCLKVPAHRVRARFVNRIGEPGDSIAAVSVAIKEGTDLGAVTLASDGPVEPVAANPYNLAREIGEPVKIVGFGVTSEDGSDSGTKRMGLATLYALEGNGMRSGELTTTNDAAGTCYGDSGGPNFMTIDGVQFVAGVTSRGTDICGSGLDIAVRVDSHIEWIRQTIAATDPGECGSDNRCASGCSTLDLDCCGYDGMCVEECGAIDPECGGDATSRGGEGQGANVSGACAAASGGARTWVWGLLIVLALVRNRRTVGCRFAGRVAK